MPFNPYFDSKYKELKLRTDEYHTNYDINQLSYPNGLGVNPDLQHYVAFYINVRGKSTLDTKDSKSKIPIAPEGNRINPTDVPIKTIVGLQGLGATGLSAIKSVVDGRVKQAGKEAINGVLATGAVVGILAAGQKFSGNLLEPDKTYRIKDVITLHVENSPSSSYGVNYQNPDLGVLAGALAGGNSAVDTVNKSILNTEAGAAAALSVASLPGIIGGPRLSDLVGATARVKTNPFTETLFQSVDFRSFDFKYRFLPNDMNETRNVQNIVKKFKEHMHPTLSDNSLFYIYPSEFEIVYYFKGQENSYVHRISKCALTDMTVNYGTDMYSTFEDGAPTEINLSLSFRELELLDRKRIRDGRF
jgi:hypothetical protein